MVVSGAPTDRMTTTLDTRTISLPARPGRPGSGLPGGILLPERFLQAYQVLTVVGTGTFGTVVKASRLADGRTVAIKFLLEPDDPEILARFFREAAVLERLRHDHIVELLAFDTLEGHPYLVTEFMEGGSLSDRLHTDSRPDVREAIRITLEVLSGVQACHEAGILHRDLKPGNILLQADRTAKIADLGLAKLVADTESLTITGHVLGTPKYMAPEVMEGALATIESDLYAVGAILRDMVGVGPQGVPPRLKELIDWACARHRAERPRSGRELARALVEFLQTLPAAHRPTVRSRGVILGAALAALALAGFAALPARSPFTSHAPPAEPRNAMFVREAALVRQGRFAEACALLRELSNRDPRDVTPYIRWISLLDRMGRIHEANCVVEQARRAGVHDATIELQAGYLAERLHRMAEAKASYLIAFLMDPHQVNGLVHLARVDPLAAVPPALAELSRSGSLPPTTAAILRLVIAKEPPDQQQLDQVADLLRKRKVPADDLYILASALDKRGWIRAAERMIDVGLELEPHNTDVLLGSLAQARTSGNRARELSILKRLGTPRPPDIVKMCRDYLAKDPTSVEARLTLVQALELAHQWDDAIAECRQVLFRSPTHEVGRVKLAGLLVSANRLQDAEREFKEGLRVLPKSEDLKSSYFQFLTEQNRLEDAVWMLGRPSAARQPRPKQSGSR
jgi:serine/threonine protein kinase